VLSFSLLSTFLSAQFKYDNISYRTVYLEDLCAELKKQPGALLLDVRSPGEYSDTSMYENLRIGRLKGAVNINISDLNKRMNELPANKQQPIFIYCSHSQRSRRCSKTLADSGYTNVYNVNGGMTELNMLRNNGFPCLNEIYETTNPFVTLSPESASALISSNKDLSILDVRKDSAFKGITTIEKLNSMGNLKGAVNIPIDQLATSLDKIPREKKILIVDSYGDESVVAATMLAGKGYKDVHIVFNGLDNWSTQDPQHFANKTLWWNTRSKYGTMSAEELGNVLDRKDDVLVLDIRAKEEFTNSVKDKTYLNKGHIESAKNIPMAELQSRANEISSYKNKAVIVYGFGGSPDAFQSAKILADEGFTKVKVLSSGLFGMRWTAANIKGQSQMMKWVVDVPEDGK
jgi:rhodanese-related sulfurtransferase